MKSFNFQKCIDSVVSRYDLIGTTSAIFYNWQTLPRSDTHFSGALIHRQSNTVIIQIGHFFVDRLMEETNRVFIHCCQSPGYFYRSPA